MAHFTKIKWAVGANRSPKMSDHERFAQVAQRKWAIVSESLRLLTKNEQMSELLIFLSEELICSFLDKKRAIPLEIKLANSQPCLKGCITWELRWGTSHGSRTAMTIYSLRIVILRLHIFILCLRSFAICWIVFFVLLLQCCFVYRFKNMLIFVRYLDIGDPWAKPASLRQKNKQPSWGAQTASRSTHKDRLLDNKNKGIIYIYIYNIYILLLILI